MIFYDYYTEYNRFLIEFGTHKKWQMSQRTLQVVCETFLNFINKLYFCEILPWKPDFLMVSVSRALDELNQSPRWCVNQEPDLQRLFYVN